MDTNTPGEQDYSLQDVAFAEKRLTDLLAKRALLAKNLHSIENSLYNLETAYIEDTTYGNIIRGYDAFLNNRTPQNRRQRPLDSERIFSQSSVSYHKVPERAATYEDRDSGAESEYVQEKKKLKRRSSDVGSSRLRKGVIASDDD